MLRFARRSPSATLVCVCVRADGRIERRVLRARLLPPSNASGARARRWTDAFYECARHDNASTLRHDADRRGAERGPSAF